MTFFFLTTCFSVNLSLGFKFSAPNSLGFLSWNFYHILFHITYLQLKFQVKFRCIKITINFTIQSSNSETIFSLATKLVAFLQVWLTCFYTYLFSLKFVAFFSFSSLEYTIKKLDSKALGKITYKFWNNPYQFL